MLQMHKNRDLQRLIMVWSQRYQNTQRACGGKCSALCCGARARPCATHQQRIQQATWLTVRVCRYSSRPSVHHHLYTNKCSRTNGGCCRHVRAQNAKHKRRKKRSTQQMNCGKSEGRVRDTGRRTRSHRRRWRIRQAAVCVHEGTRKRQTRRLKINGQAGSARNVKMQRHKRAKRIMNTHATPRQGRSSTESTPLVSTTRRRR